MALDPVPWLVENGASHSANVARNISYAAFGGNEGIVHSTDFEVREQTVPGSSVQVYPGTCAIKNRAAGIRDEMYVGRSVSATNVNISATGGSARADMVVAMVKNPWLAGEPWSAPVSNADGPYFFLQVISGVSSTAQTLADAGQSGYSAIPLARINVPASTATITQAMITDLRNLAQPRSERELLIGKPSATATLTATSYADWPSTVTLPVDIPSWANKVKMRAFLGGIAFGAAGNNGGAGWNTTGSIRCVLVGNSSTMSSASTLYNESVDAGADRTLIMAGGDGITIPVGNRGKPAVMKVQGLKGTSGVNTSLTASANSTVSLEVEFYNAAEANL